MVLNFIKVCCICFAACLFFGCELSNSVEETPVLVKIERIEVGNNFTHQISDAWVYIDNEFLGIHPLPATFPVLKSGVNTLIIEAGIKKNGISSSREKYPYYSAFTVDTLLQLGQVLKLLPEVNHVINSFPFEEDFESIGTKLVVASDSTNHEIIKVYDNSNNSFGNYHAFVEIDGQNGEVFECTTENLNLPSDQLVYLEMDYKCNATLVVGLYINYSSQVNKTAIMYLNPKENWNKIYISLSETISNYTNAQSFKLFFGTARDTSIEKNTVYLDNIRLVYEE